MATLKGLGWGAKTSEDAAKLPLLNLDWWYTWGPTPNLAPNHPGFVPMIWSDNPTRLAQIPDIAAGKLSSPTPTHLLGFNEPDFSTQADMTVLDALWAWKQLEASGLRLGSPATVSPNREWMDDFMVCADKLDMRVDFVTAHIYQSPDAANFLRKVDDLYAAYGLPVWITETAVADWEATATNPNRYGRTQVNEYLKDIWEGVQARPYVERFAWKTRASTDPVMGTSALFHTDGRLTTTGSFYASL